MVSPLSKGGSPKAPAPGPSSSTLPKVSMAQPMEPTPPLGGLSIGRARGLSLGDATSAAAGDAIPSSFPLDDLGQIQNTGRAAAGFRLDGGALRLMWLTAQRIREPEKGDGFEISFFAHGSMLQTLEGRLRDKKATLGALKYSGRELDPAAPKNQQRLVSDGESWGPSSASTLRLEQAGQFEMELVTGNAEALKGAVRIRVFGNDKTATKNLQQLVNQLGMQKLFAPPKPTDLERLKLFRFLWHVAPDALQSLKFRAPSEIEDKTLELAVLEAGVSDEDPIAKAVDGAAFDSPELRAYFTAMHVLAEHEPAAFLAWAHSNVGLHRGLIPPSDAAEGVESIRKKATEVGLDLDQPAIKKQLESPISISLARRYGEFGILLARQAPAAERLLAADLDSIGVDRLRRSLTKAGFDPDSERVQGLFFEEVYPGYFTVLDPTQPERLAELGARYLYSTAGTPARVLDILTEGQKSSRTRFSEGRLVQGKSSNSDFGSGGAFSVFTRIVTESAIANKGAFRDWLGTRPYKVILSRDLLARLDWYGYSRDNYGRSTGLTADNHGEPLIKTIQESYGPGNELMFPVGNDPSYIDFVVCSSEAQRKKLLKLLEERGLKEFNGKPIEQFVRVEKSFFEHPRDQTMERAVAAAIDCLELGALEKTLDAALRSLAEPKLAAWVSEAAHGSIEGEALEMIPGSAEKAAKASADSQAPKAAQKVAPAHAAGLQALEDQIAHSTLEAARDAVKEQAVGLGKDLPQGPIDKIIRSTGKGAAEEAAQKALAAPLAQRKQEVLSALSLETSPEEKAAAVKAALEQVPLQTAIQATQAAVVAAAEAAALSTAETSVTHHFTMGVGKTVRSATEEAALAAAQSEASSKGILAKLEAEIAEQITPLAIAAGQEALTSSFEEKLSFKVAEASRLALVERLLTEATAPITTFASAALDQATTASIEAAEQFAHHAGQKFSEANRAKAEAAAKLRATERIEAETKKTVENVVRSLPKPPMNAAIKAAITEALPGLIGKAPETAAELAVPAAAHEAALRLLRQRFVPLAAPAVESAMAEGAEALVAALAPSLAANVLESTSKAMAEYYVGLAHKARIKAELASL